MIFPVLYSAIPKDAQEAMPKPPPVKQDPSDGLVYLDSAYNSAVNHAALREPSGQFGADVTDTKLDESQYVLKGVDPGFIYLLYPNDRWKGYVVDKAGYLRLYSDLGTLDMPADGPTRDSDVEQCSREGKSHVGIEAFCIEDPDKVGGTVYVAYSRYKWSKSVREKYVKEVRAEEKSAAKKEQPVAKKTPPMRMQPILALDGSAFEHAEVASATNLRTWVVDFNPDAVRAINPFQLEEMQVRDRSGITTSLPEAMQQKSGKSFNKPGLIMALHDPVGITMALNKHRSRLTADAAAEGSQDPEKARKRIVAETIQSILKGADQQPGPWYDRNYGSYRFVKHIDKGAYDSALVDSQKFRSLQTRITQAAEDFCKWQTSPAWAKIQRCDFDGTDPRSAQDHGQMVAYSVCGSGLVKCEFERMWLPVMDLASTSENHWYYRALGALAPQFADYVASEKREDRVYDIFNKFSSGVKEAVKNVVDEAVKSASLAVALRTHELNEAMRSKQHASQVAAHRALAAERQRLHEAAMQQYHQEVKRVQEAIKVADITDAENAKLVELNNHYNKARLKADTALQALLDTSSALLGRIGTPPEGAAASVVARHREAFRRITRAVTAALITRADVGVKPMFVIGQRSAVANLIMDAAKAPIDVKPVDKAKVGTSRGHFGAKAAELADATGGVADVIFRRPGDDSAVRSMVCWVVFKLTTGSTVADRYLKAMGLQKSAINHVVDLYKQIPDMPAQPGPAPVRPPMPAQPTPPTMPAEPPKARVPPPTEGNPFLLNRVARVSAGLDIGLSAGTIFFQLQAGFLALKNFADGVEEGDGAKGIGGAVSLFTAVLAIATSYMEIVSAVNLIKGRNIAAAVAYEAAGRLTLAAGILEGLFLIGYGSYKIVKLDDTESGIWTVGAGVTTMYGWVHARNAYFAAAHGMRGTAGLARSPVTFLLYAATWLGVGIWASIQATSTSTTNLVPLEYWFDNCAFGLKKHQTNTNGNKLFGKNPFFKDEDTKSFPPFKDLEEEISGLYQVIFKPQGLITVQMGRFRLERYSYEVSVPRFSAGSQIKLSFSARKDKKTWVDAGHLILKDGSTTALENTVHSAWKMQAPKVEIDAALGLMRLSGFISYGNYDEKPLNELRIILQYWPDAKDWANSSLTETLPVAYSFPSLGGGVFQ